MASATSTAKKKTIFLDGLRDGYSVTGAARNAGVGRRTVYGWRDRDTKFAREWDDAWEARGDWYEDRNRDAANEGSMPAILNGLKMHHRIVERSHQTVDIKVQEETERIAAKFGIPPDRLLERAKELETLQ